MLTIKFQDNSYQIKNQVEEFTIREFEEICFILNEKKQTKINAWSKIFIFLGIPEEIIDEFDSFAFIQLIKEFNLDDFENKEFVKNLEIDGYTYQSFENEFKLTVREMGMIEERIEKNSNKFLGELMAIIFKRVDLTKIEHFDKAHIKYKADLFRDNVTADKAIPFIGFLSKRLINNIELLTVENEQ
jgi:hypothetical protein